MADINSIDNDPNSYYTPSGTTPAAPAKGFMRETLDAVPRIAGGIYESMGKTLRGLSEATSNEPKPVLPPGEQPTYLSTLPERISQVGKGLQERNAISPETQAEHPMLTKVANIAENVATTAPLLIASAVTGGAAAAPLIFGSAFGGKQYADSIETGKQHGLTDMEARSRAVPAALASAAFMAAMGSIGEAATSLVSPVAKTAGDVVNKTITQALKEYSAGTLADAGTDERRPP